VQARCPIYIGQLAVLCKPGSLFSLEACIAMIFFFISFSLCNPSVLFSLASLQSYASLVLYSQWSASLLCNSFLAACSPMPAWCSFIIGQLTLLLYVNLFWQLAALCKSGALFLCHSFLVPCSPMQAWCSILIVSLQSSASQMLYSYWSVCSSMQACCYILIGQFAVLC
jgi:hypothetical protein